MRPETGTRIRILTTNGHGNLMPGDVVEVGSDPHPPQPWAGYEWVQSPAYPGAGAQWGWVTWELEGRKTDPLPPSECHARRANQRRELRRLNRQCHVMRLERDQALHNLELAMRALVQTREELALERVCHQKKSSNS